MFDHRMGARTKDGTLLIVELSALLWRLHSGLYFVDTHHVLVHTFSFYPPLLLLYYRQHNNNNKPNNNI